MTNLDVKETQPSTSEIITVESQLYQQPGSSAGLPKVRDPLDCKPAGYCQWCCFAFCFPLPTACVLGQKMGDKWSWLKYAIPGKLIFDLDYNSRSPC